MNNKKQIASILIILTIVFTVRVHGTMRDEDNKTSTTGIYSQTASSKALTIKEALIFIEKYYALQQPHRSITSINSIDAPEDGLTSGTDGRRRGWQAILKDTSKENSQDLWIKLVDGVVVEEELLPTDPGLAVLPIKKLLLDSSELVLLARKVKPNFEAMNNGKGKGFHFSLEGSPDNLMVSLIGSYQDNTAIVRMDPALGTLLSSIYQNYTSGGILYSSDAGKTWQASSLVGPVNAIAADPQVERRGFAVGPRDGKIQVYQTMDGGRTWSTLGALPHQAGVWPFSTIAVVDVEENTILLVGTRTGLWSSADGYTWSLTPNLPAGAAQWLGSVQSEGGCRVFTSITTGENQGIYSSFNLHDWSRLAEGIYRLSESYDKRIVLAVDEQDPQEAILMDWEGQKPVALPEPAIRAAGDFSNPDSMAIQVPNRGVGQISNGSFHRTLSTSIASLAAAKDYPQSRIALAGGFRTGIFRTNDAGKTWQQVVAYPSAILPGSDEIVGITFLSFTDVVAINGGRLEWTDF